MEGGHKGYSVGSLLVVAFLFNNFRFGERINFVDSLLDCSGTMALGTEMSLQVPGIRGKVRVLRADTAKSEGFTVGDTSFAVMGVQLNEWRYWWVCVGFVYRSVVIQLGLLSTMTSRKWVFCWEISEVNLIALSKELMWSMNVWRLSFSLVHMNKISFM